MNIMSKAICAVAIISLVIFSACNHKVSAAPKTIAASSDAGGSHPGNTTVDGPAEVTCVTATDESQGAPPPPTCVVTGPGTNALVDIGNRVAISAAGNVVLTCKGKGALACTAEIDQ